MEHAAGHGGLARSRQIADREPHPEPLWRGACNRSSAINFLVAPVVGAAFQQLPQFTAPSSRWSSDWPWPPACFD